jgi:hypothetical protein
MKNVHLIPTDKPTRLRLDDGELVLGNSKLCQNTLNYQYQNIYITNDEEIKEGDWYYLPRTNSVYKCIEATELNLERRLGVAKIILTTDQSLDGIQAIDDEFLEWFVKNPSCENIEIEKTVRCTNCGHEYCDNLQCRGFKDIPYYKIIIPQEEPKQKKCIYCNGKGYIDNHTGSARIYCLNCDTAKEPKQETNKTYYLDELPNMNKDVLLKMWNAAVPKLEPKQETLEESAKDYIENTMKFSFNSLETKTQANRMLKCIEFGAKWQAKRMYSGEDMRKSWEDGRNGLNSSGSFPFYQSIFKNKTFNEWFKQFKKK